METLFVKLEADSDHAQWLVIGAAGNPHAAIRRGPLAQVQDFARQRRVVCLLPGNETYLNEVHLPASRSRRRYQQAAPFALEDDLAEDLDDLHFALGREQAVEADDSQEQAAPVRQVALPVAVTNKDRLHDWLQRLTDAGLAPHAIVPEILAVPWQESSWSVLFDEDRVLIRTGRTQGLICTADELSSLLETTLKASDPKPERIRVWNSGDDNDAITLAADDDTVEIEHVDGDQAPLTTLARGYQRDRSINLLQGEFSYREEYGKLLKPWRLPAGLAATLLILTFASNTIRSMQLEDHDQKLKAQMEAIYKTVAPNARNIPDPRKQLEDKLNELTGPGTGGNSEFLYLLDLASREIMQHDKVEITSLGFSDKRLDVELSLPNVQILDKLKQGLDQTKDIQTDIQSASAEGEQINGRLRIRRR